MARCQTCGAVLSYPTERFCGRRSMPSRADAASRPRRARTVKPELGLKVDARYFAGQLEAHFPARVDTVLLGTLYRRFIGQPAAAPAPRGSARAK